jgi:hypothetical protein
MDQGHFSKEISRPQVFHLLYFCIVDQLRDVDFAVQQDIEDLL